MGSNSVVTFGGAGLLFDDQCLPPSFLQRQRLLLKWSGTNLCWEGRCCWAGPKGLRRGPPLPERTLPVSRDQTRSWWRFRQFARWSRSNLCLRYEASPRSRNTPNWRFISLLLLYHLAKCVAVDGPGCWGKFRPCRWRWLESRPFRSARLPAPSPVLVPWTAGCRRSRLPGRCRQWPRWPAAGHRYSNWEAQTSESQKNKALLQITHLDTNGQIVFLNVLVIERVIDFNVGPRVAVIGALLQVERVVLVGLRRWAANQPVKDGRIAFNARTVAFIVKLESVRFVIRAQSTGENKTDIYTHTESLLIHRHTLWEHMFRLCRQS